MGKEQGMRATTLLAVTFLCATVVAISWILREGGLGPQRAATQVVLGPTWTDDITGEAIAVLQKDRAHLDLNVEVAGVSEEGALAALFEREQALRDAFAAAGFADPTIERVRAKTRGRAPSYRVTALLRATLAGRVDVPALLANPLFDGLATLKESRFWHSDEDAALLELRAKASARARKRAERLYAGLEWIEKHARTDGIGAVMAKPSDFPQSWVQMTAVLEVIGRGAR